MTDTPTIAEATVTCGGSPYQIEGTLTDGRHFYFRARFRTASLGIGATFDDAARASIASVGGRYACPKPADAIGESVEIRDEDDPYGAGAIDDDEAREHLTYLMGEALNPPHLHSDDCDYFGTCPDETPPEDDQ